MPERFCNKEIGEGVGADRSTVFSFTVDLYSPVALGMKNLLNMMEGY